MSALQKRSVLILGAAAVAMALVFIAVYDWTGDENTSPQDVALLTTERSTPSLPATVDLEDELVASVAQDEREDTMVAKFEPPREVTYEEAETAYRERRYEDATELFTAYTHHKGENPWGHYMLGLSAWKSGDYEVAEKAFERALELDPDHVKSNLNLSRVLLDRGRPMDALDRINDALSVDPESNAAYRLKGRMFRQVRQNPQAVEAYRRAIQIDDQDAWSMNNLGMIYLQEEMYDKALPPLARAVELKGDVAMFRNNLGMALELTGRYRAAEDVYRIAVDADESNFKAAANLSRIELVLEEFDVEAVDLAVLSQRFVDEISTWEKIEVTSAPSVTDEP